MPNYAYHTPSLQMRITLLELHEKFQPDLLTIFEAKGEKVQKIIMNNNKSRINMLINPS